MRNVLTVFDAGTMAERAHVVEHLDRAVFERQYVAGSARPRRKASFVSEPVASMMFEAVAAELGRPHHWPVSETLLSLSPDLTSWRFARVSPHMSAYRYQRGDSFATHRDEERQLGPASWTALSILMYVPDPSGPLVGGETFVVDERVNPDPWTIAVFAHNTWHHGAEVITGTKTVIRGDIVIELDSTM